jgi:hypothetical protein
MSLCTTDAIARRGTLEKLLRDAFPGRLKVECRHWGPGHSADDTVNFLVRFGQEGGHLVLGAHYDAVPGSPGANDNAAAVVQLLSAATRLQEAIAAGLPEPDVTFCFWDHEELFGSTVMGSRIFVEDHAGALPAKAVVFDVSGIGDLYRSGSDATGLVEELPSRPTPPSDNLMLDRAGIPAALVCALPPHELQAPMPPTWSTLHTSGDSPDLVEDAALAKGSYLAFHLASRFRAA